MHKEYIDLRLTREEAVTFGQVLMETIVNKTYNPDNVNTKWLWMLMEALSEQMGDYEEEE